MKTVSRMIHGIEYLGFLFLAGTFAYYLVQLNAMVK